MRNLMNNRLILILIAILMLSGCTKNSNQPQLTSDLNIHQSALGFFTETESGYYLSSGDFFYYSDKDNINFVKLCNKPDCEHTGENCNAYNYGSRSNTHFFNGKLVFPYIKESATEWMLTIASKNMDGTDFKIEKEIYIGAGGYDGKMHRNYFVYNLEIYEEGATDRTSTLYLLDLNHLEQEPVIIYEYVETVVNVGAGINSPAMRGEYIFFNVKDKVYRYDISSKALIDIPNYEIARKGEFYTESGIYQLNMDNDFYYRDVLTGEVTALKKDEDPLAFGPFFSDGERIYRPNYSYGNMVIPDEYNGILIYDMEGNRIDFIKYSIPTDNHGYFVIAEDKVFVFRAPDYDSITSYSYFDKGKIGTDGLEWTDVILND